MEHSPHKIPTRILIVRLSAHGDVVQTLPLLALIKHYQPKATIGWVVEAAAAPLLENHPLIDTLHVSYRKTWIKHLLAPWYWRQWLTAAKEAYAFLKTIRAQQYEVGLDVQGLFKSGVLLWLTGIPRRVGFARTREGASLFYNETLAPHNLKDPHTPTALVFSRFATVVGYDPSRPQVDLLTELTRDIGIPLPPVPPYRQKKIQTLLSERFEPTDSRPLAVLAPTTAWPSKHWTPEAWAAVVNRFSSNFRWVLVAAPNEVNTVTQILSAIENPQTVLNLCGKTELVDLYALFEQTSLMIGLDSAPLHIAAAVACSQPQNTLSLRIVGVYGPTAPGRTGPIGMPIGNQHLTVSQALACQPCFERKCPLPSPAQTRDCLVSLSPQTVWTQIEAIYPHLLENNTLQQL